MVRAARQAPRPGWYLPRRLERLIPPGRRALHQLDASLLDLRVADVIPDWGGKRATFEVAVLEPPRALVHTTQRGRTRGSWAIVLDPRTPGTHVQLRLRLAPVKHPRLADSLGGLIDAATVAGLAAGLRERVS